VSIDDALAVKECQQHLFGLAGMDLGLYWAGQALLYPLLGRFFFHLRDVVANHRLVHSDH
jgi:hypothetical protein